MCLGWMLADGRPLPPQKAYDRYRRLWAAQADPIPDLQGYFIRGLDPTKRVDKATRNMRAPQDDQIKKHSHPATATVSPNPHMHALTQQMGNDIGAGSSNAWVGGGSTNTSVTSLAVNVSVTEVGGDETRPKNKALNFLVRVAELL